ncbi:transposase [Methylohalomonas lacus]|uniref:Transposase n=1 Tax=Methylohalomonas lacus TaxID=398773 RepID=A0AAE3HNU7_9GAMM|nr:transposase [Methylohalomonas lacus]MCS3904018.1 transposase [Methylohalomonas lacus]
MSEQTGERVLQSVGVDVAKHEVVVGERDDRGRVRTRTLANGRSALEAYMAALAQSGFTGPVVVESTGFWHWPTVFAAQAAGVDAHLINPLMPAKHRKGDVRLCKTDPADAALLAHMGVTEPNLPKPCRLSRTQVRLRQLLNLQKQLERLIQSQQAVLRAHREAAELAGVAPAAALTELQAQLTGLRQQRHSVQAEIQRCAETMAEPQRVTAVAGLPGVSTALARVLTGLLDPAAPSANSWVAFVGLDVSVHRSGQKVGRSRLTKRGHSFMRKRLFQAAWGAMIHSPVVRRYYERLRQLGRSYVEALLIIARKLVRGAYALVQNPEQPVDEQRLFAVKT